jgi:hypothetical protein
LCHLNQKLIPYLNRFGLCFDAAKEGETGLIQESILSFAYLKLLGGQTLLDSDEWCSTTTHLEQTIDASQHAFPWSSTLLTPMHTLWYTSKLNTTCGSAPL